MAGGPRGPVPKRPEQRRRRNKPKDGLQTQTIKTAGARVAAPAVDPDWHPLAREMYQSLERSGQSQFYEASDWAFARLTCELLSRQLRAERVNANMIAALMSALDRLLVAEADRRRARVILEREDDAPDEPASVAIMAKYRKAAGG